MSGRMRGMLAAFLAMALLLTGCYNSRELNELAIVSGVGIDLIPGKQEYRVSFQVVNPSSTPTSLSPGSGLPSVTIISASDKTVFGALRKASKRATRQLFFAHTQLVVIGEPLAKAGINHVFDIFERSHELRLTSVVLVARDTSAESLLGILSPLESLPSLGMVRKLQNTSNVWGENRMINVFELINAISGEGAVTINGVQVVGDAEEGKKKSSLEKSEVLAGSMVNGLGVFKQGKLVGWVDGTAARGTQWILDKIRETSVNVDAPGDGGQVAINIFYSKTNVSVELRKGIPVFHVTIREEGAINEAASFLDFSGPELVYRLQDALKQQTEDEVREAFRKAQSLKSDIFGFGNELQRTHPQAWKQVENDWERYFAEGELELHVESYIRNTGMRIKSYADPRK